MQELELGTLQLLIISLVLMLRELQEEAAAVLVYKHFAKALL